MTILAVGRAFPPHRYPQGIICGFLERMWQDWPQGQRRLASIHRNARVEHRHLALPLEDYAQLDSFGAANDAFVACALELGAQAIADGLQAAGLVPADVDALFTTTVTGIASPSLEARLVHRIGLRSDIVRVPLFGLGCAGGAAGVARVADWLRGRPGGVALLLSVELCSLTLQRDDHSAANLISSALFADGAAAVVMVGAERAGAGTGLAVQASCSELFEDTEDVMGWEVSGRGFRIVLSPRVSEIARERVAPLADRFLAAHGLSRDAVDLWIAHPGGPKVLRALQQGLELEDAAVASAWRALAAHGNLSSASVLMVLHDALAAAPPPGTRAVMVALGPGFAAELVLLG